MRKLHLSSNLSKFLASLVLLLSCAHYQAEEAPLPINEIQELAQVLELIKKNHVTEKSDRELLLAAINGMLKSLDDQSRYLTAEELAIFTRVATGKQPGNSTTSGRMLTKDIAYLDIDYFHSNTAVNISRIWQELKQSPITGLIIDLRDNPGGFVESAVAVADLFISDGIIATARGRVAEASRNYPASAETLSINIPLVVLVNNQTASAAEIVAAALQDYQLATLVGNKTYGKGSIQSLMNTKFGAIQLTTSYYYSPNGRIIHENGLDPDIVLGATEQAAVADSNKIQYHQQSEKTSDWQLNWAIIALQDKMISRAE